MKIPAKTIPNPKYETWLLEQRRNRLAEFGEFDEDYFPAEYGKELPEDGAWIMMLVEVRVGKRLNDETIETISLPHLSMWFAIPNKTTRGTFQAIVQTPHGSVHVWPHEYKKTDISVWLQFSEEDGLNTHFISASGAFDEAALFYLRSRGIPKGEAQRMLLATLKDPNYCYFTFSEDLASCFSEGTGTPYLHAHNHARRKANHERRMSP
jgi:hypothetical protein